MRWGADASACILSTLPEASEQCVSTVASQGDTPPLAVPRLRSFNRLPFSLRAQGCRGWPFHLHTQWIRFRCTPPWCIGLTGQLLRSGSGDPTDFLSAVIVDLAPLRCSTFEPSGVLFPELLFSRSYRLNLGRICRTVTP